MHFPMSLGSNSPSTSATFRTFFGHKEPLRIGPRESLSRPGHESQGGNFLDTSSQFSYWLPYHAIQSFSFLSRITGGEPDDHTRETHSLGERGIHRRSGTAVHG